MRPTTVELPFQTRDFLGNFIYCRIVAECDIYLSWDLNQHITVIFIRNLSDSTSKNFPFCCCNLILLISQHESQICVSLVWSINCWYILLTVDLYSFDHIHKNNHDINKHKNNKNNRQNIKKERKFKNNMADIKENKRWRLKCRQCPLKN